MLYDAIMLWGLFLFGGCVGVVITLIVKHCQGNNPEPVKTTPLPTPSLEAKTKLYEYIQNCCVRVSKEEINFNSFEAKRNICDCINCLAGTQMWFEKDSKTKEAHWHNVPGLNTYEVETFFKNISDYIYVYVDFKAEYGKWIKFSLTCPADKNIFINDINKIPDDILTTCLAISENMLREKKS